MTRIAHETLPAGLSAIVRRRADGDLDVIVSTTLSAGKRRAAVRAGLRAMQPAGRRRAAALPVPALIMLALAGSWLRAIGRLLRVHPAASIAAAVTAAAATVAITAAPHLPGPYIGRHPPGAALAPPPGSTAGPITPARGRATPSAPAQPQPSATPGVSSTGATASSVASEPNPATSVPQQSPGAPTPAPTPTRNDGGGPICLEVLGIWVCV